MVTVVVTLPDILPCVLRGEKWDSGQGQCLTCILALYQAILDIATYLSLNKLFGFRGRHFLTLYMLPVQETTVRR